MNNIIETSLFDLIPSSIRSDKKVQDAARALDNELRKVSELTKGVLIYSRIDELPENIIDELAWQFHVDFYDHSLSLQKKRLLVKNSLPWHRIKGTPAAVENVLSAAFDESRVEEWFEYGGRPYTFRVLTKDRVTDENKIPQIIRAIETVKNVRSWLDKILIESKADANIYLGILTRTRKHTTIIPKYSFSVENGSLNLGAACRLKKHTTIKHKNNIVIEQGSMNVAAALRISRRIKIRTEV